MSAGPSSSTPTAHPNVPVLVIEPARGAVALALGDLWRFRELIAFLTWRDISVRYKQTALGAAWAVLQPFFTMVVFSVFFGRLGRIPSDGYPYPLFTFCALLPWQLFAYALSESSNSLVTNQNLVTKVYFPRLVIPLAATLSGLVDFAISLVVFLGLMAWYHTAPTWNLLALPLLVGFALVTALAVGLWLSALNVQYRDVRYTLPFLTQFWLFATPIAYPSSLVPERWRALYGLNPMAGVVEGFRWALLGTPHPPVGLMAISAVVVVALFLGGVAYFRRMERTFADTL
jgi:lipopolysaccharide transport system permease protein